MSSGEIPKQYEPAAHEKAVYDRWLGAKAFAAWPDARQQRYVIMMPLPNVTGALHMGHAMDNVMQDLLIRWHRMRGDNALWMPGTDHAGIATQAVIEKRLKEIENLTRHDVGREGLVDRILKWVDKSKKRIVAQQQQMGCSCDWDRQRFTMDEVCTAAVRETFFRLFQDGLIYRGTRLVNWDCQLQTAVADDELYHEEVQGHFWHLRYPVVNPKPGEPTHVTVATTRPETMLGDTAVAVHPDPRTALEDRISELEDRLEGGSPRDRGDMEKELLRLRQRLETHGAQLELLAEMAQDGRHVRLPLQNREIPLILDGWAKPELGSGCVKITPAHDPNDYEVWQRHGDRIGAVNILNPDGTLNGNAGEFQGLDRFDARKKVVAALERQGLLEKVEDRSVEIGHSDRSKTPVEPYLSRQWFVHMGDVEGGVVLGQGTDHAFVKSGLAQAAMDAVRGGWTSHSRRNVTFRPDPVRYGNTYHNWLSEKRPWCISRQLWWGHRIPIWSKEVDAEGLEALFDSLPLETADVQAWVVMPSEDRMTVSEARAGLDDGLEGTFELQVCPRNERVQYELGERFERAGLVQDPDVLDTWFSSGVWPHSTLGWPDPERAPVDEGQSPTASAPGRPDALGYYYPGSCLVTGRDIITLWVARMVVLGLYNLGDVPFTDVFIHATILDGKGERMSKSKGNGIDPVDIIEQYGADAMRYVLCDMQTGTQDIRLPVQAISPFTGKPLDLATTAHGRTIFTYICPDTKKEFDVLGTFDDLPAAKVLSDRFEVGRNFCNKLWNAARFALMNLEDQGFTPRATSDLLLEDRWILSRLAQTVSSIDRELANYTPSAAIGLAREFFWGSFCDWYLELIKPRMRSESERPLAGQVLAVCLDQVLRLLHPFVPFLTEALWESLCERIPVRGLSKPLEPADLLIGAAWPTGWDEFSDPALEADFAIVQEYIRAIRDLRSKYNVPPSKPLQAAIKAEDVTGRILSAWKTHLQHMAGVDSLHIATTVERPPLAAVQALGSSEVFVVGLVDPVKERERLKTQIAQIQKQITNTESKLSNDAFTAKAPPEVVERERARLTTLKTELRTLEENLSALPS